METKTKIGKVIDNRYILKRLIGSGGMGVVYSAVDQATQENVAIKLLHSRYSNSTKIVKRFYQEATLAHSLKHPNICEVTDHGCTDQGEPFLVMPLLSGSPMSKLMETHQPLPLPRLKHIATQILKALENAHKHKVVHRDLKPDNIFILASEDDDEDTVKLLDFGISKVLEKKAPSTLTSTGMVLGTIYYLAPEQARGAKRIDHRVDIYAMGVILYEALVGQLPFEGENCYEVVFKIASSPYQRPRDINPDVSPQLEHVIMKAMSFDPLKRFASAKEMHKALINAVENADVPLVNPPGDEFTDTERISVPAEQQFQQPHPHPPRRSTWSKRLYLGAAVVAAVIFGVVFWNGRGEPAPNEPPLDIADEVSVETKPKEKNGPSPTIPVKRVIETQSRASVKSDPLNSNVIQAQDQNSVNSAVASTTKEHSKTGVPKERGPKTKPTDSLKFKKIKEAPVKPIQKETLASPDENQEETAPKIQAECIITEEGICAITDQPKPASVPQNSEKQ